MKIFMKLFNGKKISAEDVARQFDMQYTQLAMELERAKNTLKKVGKIDTRLRNVENTINSRGISIKSNTISTKVKESIRIILLKQNSITSSQLSRIMNLSRTRCNEYLKSMETDGILSSFTKCRKKYYKLRQDR